MPATILVLDDEMAILRLIELTLAPQYRVRTFTSPQEALAELKGDLQPGLIICDIIMPNMSGFDFHQEVRKIGALRSVPFIYLTALDDRSHFRKGMALGADDYLTKPFTTEELISAVNLRLARVSQLRQPEDGSIMQIRSLGGLEVRLGEERVRWGARKAAEVFLFLLDSRLPVRREKLKSELWWEDIAEGSFRVINSRVRKAIDAFAELRSVEGSYELVMKCDHEWDARIFEELAKGALKKEDFAALHEASHRYGGEFLPGFDSPWTERQRGYYEELYIELLEKSLELAPSEALQLEAQRQLEAYLDRS